MTASCPPPSRHVQARTTTRTTTILPTSGWRQFETAGYARVSNGSFITDLRSRPRGRHRVVPASQPRRKGPATSSSAAPEGVRLANRNANASRGSEAESGGNRFLGGFAAKRRSSRGAALADEVAALARVEPLRDLYHVRREHGLRLEHRGLRAGPWRCAAGKSDHHSDDGDRAHSSFRPPAPSLHALQLVLGPIARRPRPITARSRATRAPRERAPAARCRSRSIDSLPSSPARSSRRLTGRISTSVPSSSLTSFVLAGEFIKAPSIPSCRPAHARPRGNPRLKETLTWRYEVPSRRTCTGLRTQSAAPLRPHRTRCEPQLWSSARKC